MDIRKAKAVGARSDAFDSEFLRDQFNQYTRARVEIAEAQARLRMQEYELTRYLAKNAPECLRIDWGRVKRAIQG